MRIHELISRQQVSYTGAIEPTNGTRAEDLETILSITRKINTSLVVSDVLSLVIDHAIRITHADRGFLMLADKNGSLKYVIGHDKNGASIHPDHFQVSASVLEDVYHTGESVCIEDALHDERFELRQSIINLELQTILCSPLTTNDAPIGVIYVDSRFIQAINRNEILRLFEILAGQAATAIQNARLYEDLKKTYEELKEANDHIIKSERMALRGEMAAEISHELNNIIGIVSLQSQALQRFIQQGDKPSSQKYVSDIQESIIKIHTFAENLLVRSSIKSQLYPMDLNALVDKFSIFIRSLKKFRKGKIVLTTDEKLPHINCDKDQIQQVLLNLANNAIEANAEATITIKTEYSAENKSVRLIVADNGPGLDPSVKEKLFTERITTKPNGHGYGLPICKKIIQNHHGEITVESMSGQGTTFIISIPAESSKQN